MAAKILVNKKQLFDDLWSIGYNRTAAKYCVSLTIITEICRKHNIPMPSHEHFIALKSGKEVTAPPFLASDDEMVEIPTIWHRRKKIDSILGSKANTVCILQTLEDYSDINKPISVADIIYWLGENYSIEVDRRTVYNAIDVLISLGYDITVEKKGSKNYYSIDEKTLEPSEVKIIMDSLALNPLLPLKLGDEICNKINKYLAIRSPLQQNIPVHNWGNFAEKNDTDNRLYYYLNTIDSAQSQGKKIEFDYMKYDTNGNKVPFRKEKYVVSPYHIRLENGMYYLCCSGDGDDEFVQVRLDRMENVRMLEEKANGKRIAGKGYPLGVTYTPEQKAHFHATIKCDNELIDKVTTDFYGKLKSINITDNGDGKTFSFSLFANAGFITEWALSVADKCEIITPPELREEVINKIKNNKYGV